MMGRALIAATCLLLCQDLAAQIGEHNSAVQAWLIELLDRDAASARTIYTALGQDETRSIEDQRISRTRLDEFRRGTRPRDNLNRRLLEINWVRPRGQQSPWVPLDQEFARLLAMPEGPVREARLAQIRGILSDPAIEPGIRSRRLMASTLRDLDQQQSSAIAKLDADIARARAEDDRERLGQLWRQRNRMLRPSLPVERWNQINRRPLAVIVQRQLQGRTETADSMARSLTSRAGGRRQSSLQPPVIPENADYRKLLAEARRRLGEFISDEDLSSFERGVMKGLAERLEELHARGQDLQGIQLLTKLPYYGNRFLR